MKKWLIGIAIIVVIGIIIYLDKNKIISWQPVSIIIAAIAAPFRLLMSIFGDKVQQIKDEHEKIRRTEVAYQQDLESQIQEGESKIANLKQEIDLLDTKIGLLKRQRELIDVEVENMDLKQRQELGRKLFGTK